MSRMTDTWRSHLLTTFSGDAWLPSIGTGLVAIGLAWAGVIVLKTRDEVWDRL